MTTAAQATYLGTRPASVLGHNGTERWASITHDDTDLVITAYRGWGITDTVRLSGDAAKAQADTIAAALVADAR